MTTRTQARFAVRFNFESRDRYRWVGLAALGLAVIAGALASLGLPPIDLHPPIHWFGIMDPLCGGTRAARYTALGEWGEAWRYNPLGMLTVLLVAGLMLRGVFGLVTGRWPTLWLTWSPRARWVAIAMLIVLVALLEIRQQGRAELLMTDTFTLVDHPPF